jgi:threonine dehydratase
MTESPEDASPPTPVTEPPPAFRPRREDVEAAAERIGPFVHRTPIATSSTLDRLLGLKAFFKCENLQKVGAFKARGAVNAVLLLDDAAAERGVATHSSGNHGAALAYAASIRGVPCTVVMPDTAPAVKFEAVAGYGARIVTCPPSERHAAAMRVVDATGATLVHPFEDPAVIAGQGTAALELLDQVPELDAVLAPIGGGGLLSGTALVAQADGVTVLGAEPALADDAFRSLASGVRQPAVPRPGTMADGLLTGIGARAFDILRRLSPRIVLVDEEEIRWAARFHLERMKLVVEPSGATCLAALRRVAADWMGRRIGIILSGGNTDFSWLR